MESEKKTESRTITFEKLNLLLMNHQGTWVLQCLQYDIAAQGETIDAAKRAFARAFLGQVIVNIEHGKEAMADVPRAPTEYWDRFRKAKAVQGDFVEVLTAPPDDLNVPPAWMVHAMSNELRLAD